MDQLAPALAWIKRNGFWIVSTVLALLLIGGWFLSSTQMDAQHQDRVRKLKSSFSEMDNVQRVSAVSEEDGATEFQPAHPNSKTQEKMTDQLRETINAIVNVWEQKRDEQKELMIFPKKFLGERTFQFFNQGKVAEDFANGTVVSATEKTYLRTYREQIPKQVASMARHLRAYWRHDEELIKAELERKAELEAAGVTDGQMTTRGGLGDAIVDIKRNKYAVIWNEVNQDLWLRKMVEFRDWDDNGGSTQDPTILQAYILQQDVWLLEAMFNVIRKVNGEASTNDLAVIKEIDYLAFGTEARSKLGQLAFVDTRLGDSSVTDPLAGDGSFDEMDDFSGGMGGMGSRGGMGGELPEGMFDINGDPSPFHGRYVNANQDAISAETVRTTINGVAFPEKDLELIVAKRVPFRLAVKMDERKINEFLAYCANSSFAFEVQQIRINKHEPETQLAFKGGIAQRKSTSGMGDIGGMGDGMSGMGRMSGMMGGMSGMRSMNGGKLEPLESTKVETRLNYDVRIEFYGIVKVYNRVRKDFLLEAVGLPTDQPVDQQVQPEDGVAFLDRRLGN